LLNDSDVPNGMMIMMVVMTTEEMRQETDVSCFIVPLGCTEENHGGCGPSLELGTAEYEAGLLIAIPRGSVYTEND
jgi:hypothetical protein